MALDAAYEGGAVCIVCRGHVGGAALAGRCGCAARYHERCIRTWILGDGKAPLRTACLHCNDERAVVVLSQWRTAVEAARLRCLGDAIFLAAVFCAAQTALALTGGIRFASTITVIAAMHVLCVVRACWQTGTNWPTAVAAISFTTHVVTRSHGSVPLLSSMGAVMVFGWILSCADVLSRSTRDQLGWHVPLGTVVCRFADGQRRTWKL